MSAMNFRMTGDAEQAEVLKRHLYAMEIDYRGHEVKLKGLELQKEQAIAQGVNLEEKMPELVQALAYAEASMNTIAEVHTTVSSELDAILPAEAPVQESDSASPENAAV